MFKGLFTKLGLKVPDSYDPTKHYNCFMETVPIADRQAVYQELRRKGNIKAKHFLSDGRLQLSVLNISAAIDAVNAAAKDKVSAYAIPKVRLIELMVTDPDLDMTFLSKTGKPGVHHAEKVRVSQIAIESDEALQKGVEYQKRHQYKKAIECYDEAIRIEPDDIRAWHNKIISLAKDGRYKEAIEVADKILQRHPNIAFLCEAKGRVLAEMGKTIDAQESISKAARLDKNIAKKYEQAIDQKVDKRFQALQDTCRKQGKNPETNVDFWFGKFVEFVKSKDVEGAYLCLQMAATIAPDYYVMHSESLAVLLPPGHLLLEEKLRPTDAEVENLRDYAQRIIGIMLGKS